MRLLAAAALALALAAPAFASEAHPTLAELEGEVMCPICHTTLDQSSSAAAQRIKAFIVRRIRAGDTKSEIENRLVDDFGPSILWYNRDTTQIRVWTLKDNQPVGELTTNPG